MPLEDLSQIDLILSPNAEGKIGLVITDSGATTEPAERLDLFRKKLGLYAQAITDKKYLRKNHPGKTPEDFYISLTSAVRPTAEMLAFTTVSPKGLPDVQIPVSFEEYPEGAWAASENAAATGQEAAESSERPELDTDVFSGLMDRAREIALLQLDSTPLFVFYKNGDKEALTPVADCEDQAELDPWLRRWAAAMPETVRHAIFVARTYLENERQEAILLYLHQRGARESLGLAQPLKKKRMSKKFVADGGFIPFGAVPNIFPP